MGHLLTVNRGEEVVFTIPEEPCSKARHRTGVRGGRVYHYKDEKTTRAQELVSFCYRSASGPREAEEGGFGVEMKFYVGKRQRRDVDNFVKLVLDGLTGLAWVDDSQVTEIAAKVIHDSDTPRSEVRVYPTDDLPDRLQRKCEHCGNAFRTYESWSTRKYCSGECRRGAVALRQQRTCATCGKEYRTAKPNRERANTFCSKECKYSFGLSKVDCAHCGKAFTRSKSMATRRTNSYCSAECHSEFWRLQRKSAAKGTCCDCGGATSKKSYMRCMSCRIKNDAVKSGPKKEVA